MLFSLPSIMCFWLARQACYIKSTPKYAIVGDIVYSLVLICSLLLAIIFGFINNIFVFLAMGIASLLALPFIISNLRINAWQLIMNNKFLEGEYKKHWSYGKWALAASIAYGASTLAFTPLIGLILGLEQAGLFRALLNFVSPLQQINTAFSSLLLPWASRQRLKLGDYILGKRLREFFALFFGISLAYLIPINVFSQELIKFYDKQYYISFLWAVPVISCIMLVTAIINSFGIVFKVLEKPNIILQSKIYSVIFIFSICILLAIYFDFAGMMIGIFLSSIIEVTILIINWRVLLKNNGGNLSISEST